MADHLAEALAASPHGPVVRWLSGWSRVLGAVAHGFTSQWHRSPSPLRPLVALKLAIRGLVRDPGTSLAASGILALGLASAATFFAILEGLTRPLPVEGGDRIVRIDVVQPTRDGRDLGVTGADLEAWQAAATLQGLGGARPFTATLRDPGRAVTRVAAAAVTPEALNLLRVAPVAGRIPVDTEAEGAILVRADLFETLFEGDADAIGRLIQVDGVAGVLAGVMPEGFGFPLNQSLWVIERPGAHPDAFYEAVGRLSDGASHEVTAAQLQARWRARDGMRDADACGGVVRVRGYTQARGESGELVLFMGLVLIGVSLLLIACANAANLLLVRATERVRVLAVQAALGASRLQLGVQLMLESLALALLGGIGGLGLAFVLAGHVERTLGPENFGYYWTRVAVDGPVVAFAGGMVVGAALLAGMLPVVRVLRTDVQAELKAGGGGGGMRGGGFWGRAFVGAQLALSCAALAAAGLTARSMVAARDFGRGVPAEAVVLATVELDAAEVVDPAAALRDVMSAAGSVAGARAASVAVGAPGYFEPFGDFELDGVSPPAEGPRQMGGYNAVGPDYFEVMDLELLSGRGFTVTDVSGAEPVAIVNEAFVARFWPMGSPLGRRVRMPAVDREVWFRVVGVVTDADLGDGPQLREDRVYLPVTQADPGAVMILARAADGDGEALAGAVRTAMAAAAPGLPLTDVRTLASGHAFMTRAQSTFSFIAVSGGASGLVVAIGGLYALLAFRVRQRRRELGIRKALGADGPRLVREVMGFALRQLAPATAVGLAIAWLAAPVLAAILLGGDPRSPVVFGSVAVTFVGVGLLAALVPALRAGRVEPATVLRSE